MISIASLIHSHLTATVSFVSCECELCVPPPSSLLPPPSSLLPPPSSLLPPQSSLLPPPSSSPVPTPSTLHILLLHPSLPPSTHSLCFARRALRARSAFSPENFLLKRKFPPSSSSLARGYCLLGLAHHFNYFMGTGEFPDMIKLGKITPIFKKEDEQLLKKYRPVSTLPIFGKIFEKIIYSRLHNFFVSQGILYDKQFGFRKSHSTNHALNYSISQMKSELKKGNHVLGIFIDLSKAFCTIDQGILIKKLEHYGVRGSVLSLLTSYLQNRKQCVLVLGEISESLPVIYGVPQGSCLGPLLFLIYINDLGKISKSCEIILFADDTNIFVSGGTQELAFTTAQEILKTISNYMNCNKLHVNLEKSCYMYFNNTSKSEKVEKLNNFVLKISNTSLPQVKHTKFFGVIIDNKLTWQPHLSS